MLSPYITIKGIWEYLQEPFWSCVHYTNSKNTEFYIFQASSTWLSGKFFISFFPVNPFLLSNVDFSWCSLSSFLSVCIFMRSSFTLVYLFIPGVYGTFLEMPACLCAKPAVSQWSSSERSTWETGGQWFNQSWQLCRWTAKKEQCCIVAHVSVGGRSETENRRKPVCPYSSLCPLSGICTESF